MLYNYFVIKRENEMIEHYEKQGATQRVNEHGVTVLHIPQDAIPFIIKKETDFDFTQEQRRYVLNILHLCLEKNEMTKEEALERIGIHFD